MHIYNFAARGRLLRLRRSLFRENNVRLLRSCFTVGSRGCHRCLQRSSQCRYRVEHYLSKGLKPTCAIKIMVRISYFSFSNKLRALTCSYAAVVIPLQCQTIVTFFENSCKGGDDSTVGSSRRVSSVSLGALTTPPRRERNIHARVR